MRQSPESTDVSMETGEAIALEAVTRERPVKTQKTRNT
jgi:hypothetical protein